MADLASKTAQNLRVSVSIDKEVLDRLDDYKLQNGLASRSQAVNQILAGVLTLGSSGSLAPGAFGAIAASQPQQSPVPVGHSQPLLERFTALIRSFAADTTPVP